MGMRYFFGVMEVLPSVEGRFQFLLRVFWLPPDGVCSVSAQMGLGIVLDPAALGFAAYL